MREKRGGKDGKGGRKKTDRESICLHLTEILDIDNLCVFWLLPLCVKTETERRERGNQENRVEEEEREEREVGSWHR